MASDSEKGFLTLVGCVPAFWQLVVTFPMWCALIYGVIISLPQPPQWLYFVFYAYVPCGAIGVILAALCAGFVKAAEGK